MIQLTDAQAALLRKLLGKLSERSTIAALLTSTLGAMGIGSAELWVQVAGWTGIAASVLLALINDQAFASLFQGHAPSPSSDVMEPVPASIPVAADKPEATPPPASTEDQSMSLLNSAGGIVSHLNPVLAAAYEGVTLIEALFPDAPGVQKLRAAQAYVTSKVSGVGDVVGTIEGVLSSLKTAGVIGSIASSVPVAAVDGAPEATGPGAAA